MAQLVLAVAGAYLMPANPVMGFSTGWTVGSVLFPPPGPDIGRLNDLSVMGSSYGTMIPIVYGQVRVGSVLIWTTPLEEHSSSVGKGGGGATEYSYTASFAVAACAGSITEIKKIWVEDILLYENETWSEHVTGRIYLGDEEQVADPLIAGIEGETSTPGYRGLAYVVFEDLGLEKWGNRIPQVSFEVNRARGWL